MSDVTKVIDWFRNNGAELEGALVAGVELVERLLPKAAERGQTLAQLIGDDAVAVRAIMDGVGLANIAGRNGLDVSTVIGAVGQIIRLAGLVGGGGD